MLGSIDPWQNISIQPDIQDLISRLSFGEQQAFCLALGGVGVSTELHGMRCSKFLTDVQHNLQCLASGGKESDIICIPIGTQEYSTYVATNTSISESGKECVQIYTEQRWGEYGTLAHTIFN